MNILSKSRACWVQCINNVPKRKRIIGVASISAVLLIVLLLILLLPLSRKPNPGFSPYNSNQGAFAIDAPKGEMVLATFNERFLDNKTTRFVHQAVLPYGTFTVIHFDMPQGVISPADRTSIFNTLITSFLEEFNGVMEQSWPIDKNGIPGIGAKATGKAGEKVFIGEVMVLMAANRIFIIGAYGDKKELKPKHIQHFMNSFSFTF